MDDIKLSKVSYSGGILLEKLSISLVTETKNHRNRNLWQCQRNDFVKDRKSSRLINAISPNKSHKILILENQRIEFLSESIKLMNEEKIPFSHRARSPATPTIHPFCRSEIGKFPNQNPILLSVLLRSSSREHVRRDSSVLEIMDFTRFMNKFNDFEKQLSPTSALKLSFDNITPESDEPPEVNKRFWGVPVPEFVSEWIEDEFSEPPTFYEGFLVLRKVRRLCNRSATVFFNFISDFRWKTFG